MAEHDDLERFRLDLLERGPDCAGATGVGPVRDSNEDAFWISADASVLVVADGLGGLPAGELASILAVAAVAEVVEAGPVPAQDPPGPGNGEVRAGETAFVHLAHEAAMAAHQRVMQAAVRNPECRGMATTLVLALVDNNNATILHVGDSCAMLWREGRVVQRTYDHNGVGDLLRAGAITPEQARHHPARNLVREVLGLRDGYEAECGSWDLEHGDVLLLCTDGVSDAIGEETIARVLAGCETAAAGASSLVEVAGLEGGHDNATAVVLRVT